MSAPGVKTRKVTPSMVAHVFRELKPWSLVWGCEGPDDSDVSFRSRQRGCVPRNHLDGIRKALELASAQIAAGSRKVGRWSPMKGRRRQKTANQREEGLRKRVRQGVFGVGTGQMDGLRKDHRRSDREWLAWTTMRELIYSANAKSSTARPRALHRARSLSDALSTCNAHMSIHSLSFLCRTRSASRLAESG